MARPLTVKEQKRLMEAERREEEQRRHFWAMLCQRIAGLLAIVGSIIFVAQTRECAELLFLTVPLGVIMLFTRREVWASTFDILEAQAELEEEDQ